jgi:hypothetical protein
VRTITNTTRSFALGTAAVVLVFLAASAPYRVHHNFADLQLAPMDTLPGASALALPQKREYRTELDATDKVAFSVQS